MVTDLASQLRRDEGTKFHLYRDSVGKWTIGTGRNLDDVGISEDEAELMLANDIKAATSSLESTLPWTAALDDVRKGVLLNMAFNMGIRGLSGFQQFLASVKVGDWKMAALNMLNSRWATQVGARAQRLALQMTTGEWQ